MENILLKMPSETIPRTTLTEISRKSEGLSGAWVREVVQSAFIEAIYQGRERLNAKDLQEGLADVLKRRGMAYQSTPNLAQVIESKNAEVYTM
jgi:ATP-dependent 26S proteasome regulatory subunit